MIYVSDINYNTIVDGEGIRDSVYCSFCDHKCKGCHNPSTWDINSGKPMSINEIYIEFKNSKSEGVTWSGGDPMYQAKKFSELSKLIKENTSKNIWCYTGFTFEEILKDNDKLELLRYVDVLVDGKFEIENKDLKLLFKGSSNQRIINVKESLEQNKVILYYN